MIILYVLIVWFQNQRWACHIAGCCEENTDEPSQKKVMTEQEKMERKRITSREWHRNYKSKGVIQKHASFLFCVWEGWVPLYTVF